MNNANSSVQQLTARPLPADAPASAPADEGVPGELLMANPYMKKWFFKSVVYRNSVSRTLAILQFANVLISGAAWYAINSMFSGSEDASPDTLQAVVLGIFIAVLFAVFLCQILNSNIVPRQCEQVQRNQEIDMF